MFKIFSNYTRFLKPLPFYRISWNWVRYGVGKSIKGSKIFVLGLAYKKNVYDSRESPSFTIMELLMAKGADVHYSDPHLPKAPKTRKFNYDLTSVELTVENIKSFELLILLTDHDEFEFDLIEKYAKLLVDTRGKYKASQKVVSA